MNRWDITGIPHKGWACRGVYDLEEATHTCEMCGKESIRFVHWMEHSGHKEMLQVGCVCAEKMAFGYDAKGAERTLRNRATRRFSFVSKGWKTSKKGHLYKKKNRLLVVVGEGPYGIFAKVGNTFLRGRFATVDDAKNAAFETIDSAE